MTRLEVVRQIIADCEADVTKREGQVFDGHTMAEYMGETLALIHALARVVESLLVEMGKT